jgi:glucose/arabinose dehydrogenase
MWERTISLPILLTALSMPLGVAMGGGSNQLALDNFGDANGLVTRMVSAPGDDTRLFVATREGRVQVLNWKTAEFNEEPFIDLSNITNSMNGEAGLSGMIFHPDYQENGRFFLYVTLFEGEVNADNVLFECARDGDDHDLAEEDVTRILKIEKPTPYHNGGWMEFDAGGNLLISTGDGGGGNGGGPRAQNITDGRLLGKLLRIDIDGDDFPSDPVRNYAIPSDNPFVGTDGDDEIWVFGLRNPWSGSRDPQTGDIFLGDVGRVTIEELDVIVGGGAGGENYGWRCMEGSMCTGFNVCTCNAPGLELPLWEYEHNDDPGRCAIIGAEVYRGCAMPFFDGHVLTSDLCTNEVWSLEWSPAEGLTDVVDRTDEISKGSGFSMPTPTTMGHDARGELWIGCYTGDILKVVPQDMIIKESDFNCDGMVNVVDLLRVLSGWGSCNGCREDIDGDHQVTVTELLQVISDWG